MLAAVVATWFGAGFFPMAPGTFGSAAGLPLILLMHATEGVLRWGILGGIVAAAFWSAGRYAARTGRRDPSEVVVDEVAGYALALSLVPWSWPSVVGVFFFFRVFDVIKPFPVGRLERVPGGWGIVLDDLAAGLCAAGTWRLVLWVGGWS